MSSDSCVLVNEYVNFDLTKLTAAKLENYKVEYNVLERGKKTQYIIYMNVCKSLGYSCGTGGLYCCLLYGWQCARESTHLRLPIIRAPLFTVNPCAVVPKCKLTLYTTKVISELFLFHSAFNLHMVSFLCANSNQNLKCQNRC